MPANDEIPESSKFNYLLDDRVYEVVRKRCYSKDGGQKRRSQEANPLHPKLEPLKRQFYNPSPMLIACNVMERV